MRLFMIGKARQHSLKYIHAHDLEQMTWTYTFMRSSDADALNGPPGTLSEAH